MICSLGEVIKPKNVWEVPWSLLQEVELFTLVNLELVQSLASGLLSLTEAVERFYHADTYLYVRRDLRKREANAIMSRGTQLPGLLECLPAEDPSAGGQYWKISTNIRKSQWKLIDPRLRDEVEAKLAGG